MIEQRLATYRERLKELDKEEFPDEARRTFLLSEISDMEKDIDAGIQYPTIQYPHKKPVYTLTDSVERIEEAVLNGKPIDLRPRWDWGTWNWAHEIITISRF